MSGFPPGWLLSGTSPIVDPDTLVSCSSPHPGFSCPTSRVGIDDEITPIAFYMANEMNSNAHGPDVKIMAELNAFNYEKCISDYTQLPWWQQLMGVGIKPGDCVDMKISGKAAAMLIWTGKVRQNGDWDHKPKISGRFHPRVPNGTQEWHHHNGMVYFYDIWSNLHYGYVGTAAGFSESTLLDGAGGEQIVSDIMRGNGPKRSPGVGGLRAFDEAHDRAAITMGIQLYKTKPNQLFPHDLVNLIVHSPNVQKKPLAY